MQFTKKRPPFLCHGRFLCLHMVAFGCFFFFIIPENLFYFFFQPLLIFPKSELSQPVKMCFELAFYITRYL